MGFGKHKAELGKAHDNSRSSTIERRSTRQSKRMSKHGSTVTGATPQGLNMLPPVPGTDGEDEGTGQLNGRKSAMKQKAKQDTLHELLQIVSELLQQHEVRLCLYLLEEFSQCQSLAGLPLETDGLDMWHMVSNSLESQLQQNGTDALQQLLQRCKNGGKTKGLKRGSLLDIQRDKNWVPPPSCPPERVREEPGTRCFDPAPRQPPCPSERVPEEPRISIFQEPAVLFQSHLDFDNHDPGNSFGAETPSLTPNVTRLRQPKSRPKDPSENPSQDTAAGMLDSQPLSPKVHSHTAAGMLDSMSTQSGYNQLQREQAKWDQDHPQQAVSEPKDPRGSDFDTTPSGMLDSAPINPRLRGSKWDPKAGPKDPNGTKANEPSGSGFDDAPTARGMLDSAPLERLSKWEKKSVVMDNRSSHAVKSEDRASRSVKSALPEVPAASSTSGDEEKMEKMNRGVTFEGAGENEQRNGEDSSEHSSEDDNDDDDDDAAAEEEAQGRFLSRALSTAAGGGTPANRMSVKEGSGEDETTNDFDDMQENANNLLAVKSAWYIMHPNSVYRIRWDLVGVVFICVESFLVPLSLGFDIEANVVYFWMATSFFGCDIMSQFFTGFYKEGWLVMKQSMIIKHYVTGFFPIDFVATVPWDMVLGGGGQFARIARVGKLLRLTRLVRVLKLGPLFEQIEDMMPGGSAALLFSLVKMLTGFCVICHWVACFWGFLGAPQNTAPELDDLPPHTLEDCEMGGACEYGVVGSPWQRRNGLDNYGPDKRYLVALQFATGLLTGGDPGLQPGHDSERVFVNIMMVFSFLLASMVLSQIVVIVEEMSAAKAELNHRLRCAKEFMAVKKVPMVLQAKVRRYLEYQSKMAGEAQLQNREFTEHLSQWIRLELMEHMNGETIYRHPFFKELPRPVLQRICGVTNTVLCAPGDIVVQRGHRATSMCWVVKGKLRIIVPKSQIRRSVSANDSAAQYEAIMSAPCWIGDACLFKDMTRPCTAISMAHSELLTLDKVDMCELLEDYPRSLRHYSEWTMRMNDGLPLAGGVACPYCQKLGHVEDMCSAKNGRASRVSGRGSILSRVSEDLGTSSAQFSRKIRSCWKRKKSKQDAKTDDSE